MLLSESQSVYYVVFSYGVNPAAAKFEAAFAHATGNTKRPISRGCQTLLWRRRFQRSEQKSGESFFPLFCFIVCFVSLKEDFQFVLVFEWWSGDVVEMSKSWTLQRCS